VHAFERSPQEHKLPARTPNIECPWLNPVLLAERSKTQSSMA
jgi:hypothetical protein